MKLFQLHIVPTNTCPPYNLLHVAVLGGHGIALLKEETK